MNKFETRFIRENFTFRTPTQIINLDYDQLCYADRAILFFSISGKHNLNNTIRDPLYQRITNSLKIDSWGWNLTQRFYPANIFKNHLEINSIFVYVLEIAYLPSLTDLLPTPSSTRCYYPFYAIQLIQH